MRLGFSLVELSIVLVILGLLTGGILAGQSLIRASEVHAVTTEHARFHSALSSFRDKYLALPGDMANATSFWSTDPGGCPGTNATSTSGRTTTCNGNSNGSIHNNNPNSNETYRAWQQLAAAGLVTGSYTGVANSTTASDIANSLTTPNVPASRMGNANWMLFGVGSRDISDTSLFDGNYGNSLMLSSGVNGQGAVLKPEEAWNIDTKMDDGKPGTGNVTSRKNSSQANASTGCSDIAYTTTASIAVSSSYLLSYSGVSCSLVMKTSH